jgi:hypothetical protein
MALFAKTLRIQMIITSKVLRFKFSTLKGLILTTVLIGVLVLIMVILTAANPQFSTEVVEESDTGQYVHIISCGTASRGFEFSLYAYESAVLFSCAKVSAAIVLSGSCFFVGVCPILTLICAEGTLISEYS